MIKHIQALVLRAKTKPQFLIDAVKQKLIALTAFFERLSAPAVTKVPPIRAIDVPSSHIYNDFLTCVEDDVNLIRAIQQDINANMLASWNVAEGSYPEQIQPASIYDDAFTLEHDAASVVSDRLTLGIKNFTSLIPQIKDKPILKAECSDKEIPVYYGKMFGIYTKGNESGEDGVRYENNDGALVVDDKDTFWECEAVVLQEARASTKFFQSVHDKDISLITTVKIIFKEPVAINTLTINPYSSAVSTYYKLEKVEVSDGVKVLPVTIKETFVMGETSFIFNVPDEIADLKVRSMFITLKQENGYYMKYMLGYFKIKNNESWLDITGSHVCQMALARGTNFNANVSHVVENAPEWILNYWLPGITFNELPQFVTTMGEDGYLLVPSSESKRKRYTVGITDIKVGYNEYSDVSEKVTNEIDIPEGYNSVFLETNDEGEVYYFLSFDNGMTWWRIVPLGKEPVRGTDLRLLPNKIYINSDLSLRRKRNTDTGEQAFVSTTSKKIRVRFVLKNQSDGTLPSVFNWNLKFGVN